MAKKTKDIFVGGDEYKDSTQFIRAIELLSSKTNASIRFTPDDKTGLLSAQLVDAITGAFKTIDWGMIASAGGSVGAHSLNETVQTRFTYTQIGGTKWVGNTSNLIVSPGTGPIAQNVVYTPGGKKTSEEERLLREKYLGDPNGLNQVADTLALAPPPGDKGADKLDKNADDRDRRSDRRWRASISAIHLLTTSMGKLGSGFDSLSRTLGGAVSGGNIGAAFGPVGAMTGAVLGMIPELISFGNKIINAPALVNQASGKTAASYTDKNSSLEMVQKQFGLTDGVMGQLMKLAPGVGVSANELAAQIGGTFRSIKTGDRNKQGDLSWFAKTSGLDILNPEKNLPLLVSRAKYLVGRRNSGKMTNVEELELQAGERAFGGFGAIMALSKMSESSQSDVSMYDNVKGEIDNKIRREEAKAIFDMAKQGKEKRLTRLSTSISAVLRQPQVDEKELLKFLEESIGPVGGKSVLDKLSKKKALHLGHTTVTGASLQFENMSPFELAKEVKTLVDAERAYYSGDKAALESHPEYKDYLGLILGGGKNESVDSQFTTMQNVNENILKSLDPDQKQKLLAGKLSDVKRRAILEETYLANEAKYMLVPGMNEVEQDEKLGKTREEKVGSLMRIENAIRRVKKRNNLGEDVTQADVVNFLMSESAERSDRSFYDGMNGSAKKLDEAVASAMNLPYSSEGQNKGLAEKTEKGKDNGDISKVTRPIVPESVKPKDNGEVDIGGEKVEPTEVIEKLESAVSSTDEAARSGEAAESALKAGTLRPEPESQNESSGGFVMNGNIELKSEFHMTGTLDEEHATEFAKSIISKSEQANKEMLISSLRKACPSVMWKPL